MSEKIKKELQVAGTDSSVNEFFMLYADFLATFENLDLVHVNLNAFYTKTEDYDYEVNWKNKDFFGAWTAGDNAGGCGNENSAAFFLNPQYSLSLKLENKNDNKVSLIAFLMQTEDNASQRTKTQGKYVGSNYAINFSLFRVKGNISDRNVYTEDQLEKIGDASAAYLPHKSVSARFNVEPGNYVIIPAMFDHDVSCKFLLRVFMEGSTLSKIVKYSKMADSKAEELIEKLPGNAIGGKAKDAYHKAQESFINPAGAAVSRACLLM